jgi:hypothetical protein
MSKYLANLFLARAPSTLDELESEIKKTLKFHMTGTWKKPSYNTPYLLAFDDLNVVSQSGGEPFFDGAFWHNLDKSQKQAISVGEFFDRIKSNAFVKSADVSDEILQDLATKGEVLFPDGSFLSHGNFSFGPRQKVESCLATKFSKTLLIEIVDSGGQVAAKNIIKRSNGALLLCEFSEAPQW